METSKIGGKALIDKEVALKMKLRSLLSGVHKEIITVYLFGSYVKGGHFEESDVDIALFLDDEKICPDDHFDYRLRIVDIFAPVFETEMLDIIILNEASTLLKFEVIKHGKVIFCGDDILRIAAEVKVMKEYYDTQYYRNISNAYLKERIKAAAHGI